MSDPATPLATGSVSDAVDHALSLLDRDDAGGDAGTEAQADPEQATEAAPEASELPPGEQSDEQETKAEPEATEPKYRVKVRGEEREVTLDELRKGYSRTEDYTAKTAEIAEQRRAVERERAEVTARAQQLDKLVQQAPYDPVLIEGQKTDWAKLAQDDPASYVQKRAAFEQRVGFWQQAEAERTRIAAEAHQNRLREADAKLAEAVPEWKVPEKRAELARNLTNTLKEFGFAEDEYASLADHRILLLVRDAMLHRQAQSARSTAEAKRASAPVQRVLSPGPARDSGTQSAKSRDLITKAKSSGKTEDAVNAVLASLGM